MNHTNQTLVREFFDTHAKGWNDRCYTAEQQARIPGIIANLNINPDNTILDIGSGSGILIPYLQQIVTKSGCIIELDISSNMLREARKAHGNQGIEYLQAGVETLPLKTNSVDCAVCFSVFPHFEDKQHALTELRRIIRKDGSLYILHLEGSVSLNACHRTIGGAVTDHKLPGCDSMRHLLLSTGWIPEAIRDTDHEYYVCAH